MGSNRYQDSQSFNALALSVDKVIATLQNPDREQEPPTKQMQSHTYSV